MLNCFIAAKRDLWNLFLWYQCYSDDTWPWIVESLTVPYTLDNNNWKFDNKVNMKMRFYFEYEYVENAEKKML